MKVVCMKHGEVQCLQCGGAVDVTALRHFNKAIAFAYVIPFRFVPLPVQFQTLGVFVNQLTLRDLLEPDPVPDVVVEDVPDGV